MHSGTHCHGTLEAGGCEAGLGDASVGKELYKQGFAVPFDLPEVRPYRLHRGFGDDVSGRIQHLGALLGYANAAPSGGGVESPGGACE